MSNESDVQARTMLAIGSLPGVRVFRNTVGFGWHGKVLTRKKDLLVLGNPRPVTFGLCPGSPDLVGWREMIVTQEMVGTTVALFLGIEMKDGGAAHVAEHQSRFIDALQRAGAVAGIVRCPEDALRLVGDGT